MVLDADAEEQDGRGGDEIAVKQDGLELSTHSMPRLQQDDAVASTSTEDTKAGMPQALVGYVVILRSGADGQDEEGEACSATAQVALAMTKSNVSPQRIAAVAGYIAQLNAPLIRLWNPIGPEGVRLLGNALVTNNTLQFLELDSCDLVGSAYRPQLEGVLALSKGIQSVRSSLRYVNIAGNDLQPEGCRILLGALSFHRMLTALDMSDNMLSLFNDKQGYLALSYLLQYSKRLCWLSIADNPLTARAAATLQGSLAANHSLTSLYAARCGVSKELLLGSRVDGIGAMLAGEEDREAQTKRRPGALLHTLEC
ncbi:hypothetical protein BBJ28_00006652 [Nothophytophthora sp. Chile5]|nr:hypothetical protein BBJ28_00006652 [Nothophytophthora sp. Chile5]